MHISFAWTAPAFIARRKRCTRRDWPDHYAERFPIGSEHVATSRQLRYGGHPIGTLGILDIYKEDTALIPDSDWEAEGFAYLTGIGARCGKLTPREIWDDWHEHPRILWVVRFDPLSIAVPTTGDLFAPRN